MTTESNNKPTHIAKTRIGYGKNARYEHVGAAWVNPEDDTVYVKLHGTQIIDTPITCYPVKSEE